MSEEELVTLRTCNMPLDNNVYETTVGIFMENGCDDLYPVKNNEDDACFDLFAAEEVTVEYGETKAVSFGFRIELPKGWEAQIRSRSGNALKVGFMMGNAIGTVDSGYQGLVKAIVYYHGIQKIGEIEPKMVQQHGTGMMSFQSGYKLVTPKPLVIKRGDKIAQMKISRVPMVKLVRITEMGKTSRGSNGFGSSGLAGV